MNADIGPPPPDEIRFQRQSHGLTQEEAARLIYAARRAWQEWEGGRRAMHPGLWELWRRKVSEMGINETGEAS